MRSSPPPLLLGEFGTCLATAEDEAWLAAILTYAASAHTGRSLDGFSAGLAGEAIQGGHKSLPDTQLESPPENSSGSADSSAVPSVDASAIPSAHPSAVPSAVLSAVARHEGLSFAYWCLNPNSGDTGGLLLDDWRSPHAAKRAALAPYLPPHDPSRSIGTSSGGLINHQ